jgi:predicted transcriptional regulator
MSTSPDQAVLDQLFDPVTQCLTPEVAQRIASLRASDKVQERLDELADKSSEGSLSPAERAEYETWVRAINFLGVLQAKARRVVTSGGAA